MSRKISLVVAFLFLIATVTGCGVLEKLGFQGSQNDELRPASSVSISEEDSKKFSDKVPIHLYFVNEDGTKLKLEVRYIPAAEAKKGTGNLASMIVKELIKGPEEGKGGKPSIPAGTTLRSPITVNAGAVTVDLTKDFVDKHPGGKLAEQLTIYSIVNSLTELKEIQKVSFSINGKVQKDFKGSFQFDVPFQRSPNVIAKTSSIVQKTDIE